MQAPTIHLVSSPSTAGSLQWSISKGLLSGNVRCARDEPALGPLDNGTRRMQFWLSLGYTSSNNKVNSTDMFEFWKMLQEELINSNIQQIILWLGETGSDFVFERMACYWLVNNAVQLFRVSVPPANGIYATAGLIPEKLSSFISSAKLITKMQRQELSADYERIIVNPGMLRELDLAGNLHFRNISAHDELLLSNITKNWQSAAKVVGEAMANADPRNPLGDAFFASRLYFLLQENIIEGIGPLSSLRLFKVRKLHSD